MRLFCAGFLALAACAGGPLDEGPPLASLSLAVEAIETGEPLAFSRWEPEGEPRAIILALHGFGDYGPSTFSGPAEFWAERGFLTYAYDQRGFGRNESRGVWPGAERLIEDFRLTVDALRARHPGVPLVALGHSMGGGVALAGVGEGAGVDGLILASPAVWGGARLALPYRAAAWSGALLFPEKRWSGDGIVRIQASDNIPALRALGADPLYLGKPSSREFMGLIRLMDRAVAAAPSVAAPTLTLYGEKDEVAPRGAVLSAHGAIPAAKELKLYEEGWHLLFRDLQAKRVWTDVADWIESEL